MKVQTTKGQAAFEFVSYFGFFLLVFLLFISITITNQQQTLREREETLAKEVAISFAEELNFAVAIGDGYYKEYTAPQKILGIIDYELRINGKGYVLLNYSRGEKTFSYVYPIATQEIDLAGVGPLQDDYALIDKTDKVKIKFYGGKLVVEQ